MEKLDVAIIVSKEDPAGMNIAEQLQQLLQFPTAINNKKTGLFLREQEIISLENIDKEIKADVFVFASKHVSEAGVNSLTVHSVGNWSKAGRGGKEKTLVKCPAALMKSCLKLLAAKAEGTSIDYEVAQEATHHGPYIEKPGMFIEIGSDEERWNDEKAGKIIAATLIEAIEQMGHNGIKTVVGIGGLYYGHNFKKIMLSPDLAVSYICSKHLLGALDDGMLKQAMRKSVPEATSVVLDWKGLGSEKAKIVQLLEKLGINHQRTSDFA